MESLLSRLRPGMTGEVRSLQDGGRNLAVRLRDLGLTEGTPVTCVMTAPLGDPAAYRFRGTLIALRRADADVVSVELSELPQTMEQPMIAAGVIGEEAI